MPKKKNEAYGFNVDSTWTYPDGKSGASYGKPPRTAAAQPARTDSQAQRILGAQPPKPPRTSAQAPRTATQAPRSAGQKSAPQGRAASSHTQGTRPTSRQTRSSQGAGQPKGTRPNQGARPAPRTVQVPPNRNASFVDTKNGDRRADYLREQQIKQAEAHAAAIRAEAERRRAEEAARRAEEKRRREAYRRRMEELARREERRRAIEEARRKAERRRRRRHAFKVFKFHLRVVLFTFIASSVILAAGFYIKFWNNPEDVSWTVSYTYGREEVKGVSSALAYDRGQLRLDFSRVAEYLGFSVVGDSDCLKYVVEGFNGDDSTGSGEEQYVEFYIGQDVAIINGTTVNLSANSLYSDSSLWVSADIMDYFSSGIEYKESRRKVSLSKKNVLDEDGNPAKDKEGNYLYEEIDILFKSVNRPILEVAEDNSATGSASTVSFVLDLTSYEKYMNPAVYSEYLVLVNSKNPLGAEYKPSDLTKVKYTKNDGRATQEMREYAEKSLEAMILEMNEAGFGGVAVTLGYRSYNEQSELFNKLLAQELERGVDNETAKKNVLKYTPLPGTSEFQTGLACELHNLKEAGAAFSKEGAYKWLSENAWKFGYILRYPEGKEDVTGMEFNPCVYRFVGRYAAEQIHKSDMCLEEYVK